MVRPFLTPVVRYPTTLRRALALAVALAAIVVPRPSQGQDATAPAAAARDRLDVRAEFTPTPPVIDGRLDDAGWTSAVPVGDFIASEPREGVALTERTLVRVLYDRDRLYIGVYCYDSDPARIVVSELKRDFDSHESDAFGVAIDPFLDRRNGFSFFVNPGAAKRDLQALADGRQSNLQWDGVWDTAATVQADGWVVEIAIPFKTLGVRSASATTMGINFKRRIRRKNEEGYWSFVPRRFTINRFSLAGELTGLGQVATGGNLRLKPFATTDVRGGAAPAAADAFDGKVGLDAKYRVGEGMALDATYNTDFSQADVDQQQVNLTRFSLFFPEKRDFFLENAGIFQLGDTPNQRSANGRSEEMQLFYSRRIGLSQAGQPLPLLGGVRLSGRSGPYTVGVMNIQQRASGTVQANNFTVARVRRDLVSKVDFGGIAVYRRGERGDYNAAYGVDFNSSIKDRLTVNGYHARTSSPGVSGRNAATQVATQWDDGFVNGLFIAADIGEQFDPQAGFVPRRGVRNYQTNFGLKPRPRSWPGIREINPHTNVKFFTDRQNLLLTRDEHYAVSVAFNNGGRTEVSINPQFERLTVPFRLPNGVTIPVGEYRFREYRLVYSSDKSRTFSGATTIEKGGYYDGDRTRATFSTAVALKPRLTTDVSYEYNLVTLPTGSFRADLYGLRSIYSFSPRMFADAYVQYNTYTGTTLTNLRFNFTYRPLSDFIIVYNETMAEHDRDTWRSLVVKFTRMLQF